MCAGGRRGCERGGSGGPGTGQPVRTLGPGLGAGVRAPARPGLPGEEGNPPVLVVPTGLRAPRTADEPPGATSGGPGSVAALASGALRKLTGAFQPSPGARLSPAGVLGWLLSVPPVAASICLRLFLTKKLRRSVLLSPAGRKVLHFFFFAHTLHVDTISLLVAVNLQLSQNAPLNQNADLWWYVLFCN